MNKAENCSRCKWCEITHYGGQKGLQSPTATYWRHRYPQTLEVSGMHFCGEYKPQYQQ